MVDAVDRLALDASTLLCNKWCEPSAGAAGTSAMFLTESAIQPQTATDPAAPWVCGGRFEPSVRGLFSWWEGLAW